MFANFRGFEEFYKNLKFKPIEKNLDLYSTLFLIPVGIITTYEKPRIK